MGAISPERVKRRVDLGARQGLEPLVQALTAGLDDLLRAVGREVGKRLREQASLSREERVQGGAPIDLRQIAHDEPPWVLIPEQKNPFVWPDTTQGKTNGFFSSFPARSEAEVGTTLDVIE